MNIPESVKKVLPSAGQQMFAEAYADASTRHDDATSFKIAWGVTKKHFRKEGEMFVANNMDFVPEEVYSFRIDPTEEILITNDENGDVVVDGVLATTEKRRSDGRWYGIEELQEIADQINTQGMTFPDTEHLVLNEAAKKHMSIDEVMNAVREQKGIFTKIKAAVKDGKLWIRAWLDKRYQKIVQKYKYLSIEATGRPDAAGRLRKPRAFGLTFTNNPNLPGAVVAV